MPFKSEAQRRFMWAKHPKIAERWAHEGQAVTKSARKAHGMAKKTSGSPVASSPMKAIGGGKSGGYGAGKFTAKKAARKVAKKSSGRGK